MNTLILFISLAVVISAGPQYGGGSAGGLLGHHQPLEHHIIGLSRGGEEEEHYGGGEEGGHGGHEEQSYKGESIGFSGSDFRTPVDVHHEKEIHLKAKPEYHYDYHVADHKHKDYKSKHETRDGYKVKGTYSLLEPDHKTIRVIDYVSDKKLGFIAKVSYKKHQ
uniref:Cuticular protein 60 n=1 Tax=Leptinotarsa decemlineata TaxID=7539 RepID=A0A3Q8HFT1_LEPDE|nr:adult-specific cuticular protein ACP-22-like [Leptinotarsa decemlineata]AYA49969.1 cuticular protein 60 [Leptinotarsa decemlineata]